MIEVLAGLHHEEHIHDEERIARFLKAEDGRDASESEVEGPSSADLYAPDARVTGPAGTGAQPLEPFARTRSTPGRSATAWSWPT
jgi:hypothetical protein